MYLIYEYNYFYNYERIQLKIRQIPMKSVACPVDLRELSFFVMSFGFNPYKNVAQLQPRRR